MMPDYTLMVVMTGAGLLGAACGLISSVNVLREQSLLGDVISHSALPGVIIAFILTGSKELSVLILGGLVSAVLGIILIQIISNGLNRKKDEAFAIIVSVSFGLSILLISLVQRKSLSIAGLESFIFGQAATMVKSDLMLISFLFVFITGCFILLRKEIMLAVFDPILFRCLGFSAFAIETVLIICEILAIVIGIRAVGVVLLVSMLIAPMAAARHWSNNFYLLMVMSSLVGLASGVSAAVLSSLWENMPTGPIMILILSAVVFISLFFSPRRGIIRRWYLRQRGAKLYKQEFILRNLYELSMNHSEPFRAHSLDVLQSLAEANSFRISQHEMSYLAQLGNISECGQNQWCLTQKGLDYLKGKND